MIPSNAKKVFSGVLFDVYQWPQKMFDGTTATFEMLKRQDTAEILVVKDNQIMIQEQEQPNKPKFYCFPGGRIEAGEEPLEGAKRELLEESGYRSETWELFHSVKPLHKLEWHIYVFIARDVQWIQEPHLDPGEKIKTLWVTLDELLDLIDSGKMAWIEQDLRMQLIRAKYYAPAHTELEHRLFGLTT